MYKFICYFILILSLFSCKGKDNEIVDFRGRSTNKINIKVSKIVSNSDYNENATLDDYKITFVCTNG